MYEIYYGYTGKGYTLDECLEHIIKNYISKLWKLSINHNIFTISERTERHIEKIKYVDNLGQEEILYSYDKEINSVEFISPEIESWLCKWKQNLENIDNEISNLKNSNITYVITFDIHCDDDVSPYKEFDCDTLEEFKEQLYDSANYDYYLLTLPNLSNISNIDKSSFSCTSAKTGYTSCITKITKKHKAKSFIYGVPVEIEEEGCIYSSGELTDGIKHCSKEVKEWLDNFEGEEELKKLAIKHWNFID